MSTHMCTQAKEVDALRAENQALREEVAQKDVVPPGNQGGDEQEVKRLRRRVERLEGVEAELQQWKALGLEDAV